MQYHDVMSSPVYQCASMTYFSFPFKLLPTKEFPLLNIFCQISDVGKHGLTCDAALLSFIEDTLQKALALIRILFSGRWQMPVP